MDFLNPLSNQDEDEKQDEEVPYYEHYANYFHDQVEIQKGTS